MGATTDPLTTRRFTADEVWRMVEIGLLGADEPYELLDGELVYVSPQGEPHAKVIGRLNMLLSGQYGPSGHVVRVQAPLGGIIDSIPEPDLAVVTLDVAEQERPPRPEQVILLIEVSATSLRRDRRKGAIYAASGTPEYWLVDVIDEVVTAHRAPNVDGTWRDIRRVGLDGILMLPGTSAKVPAAAILRPASPGVA